MLLQTFKLHFIVQFIGFWVFCVQKFSTNLPVISTVAYCLPVIPSSVLGASHIASNLNQNLFRVRNYDTELYTPASELHGAEECGQAQNLDLSDYETDLFLLNHVSPKCSSTMAILMQSAQCNLSFHF